MSHPAPAPRTDQPVVTLDTVAGTDDVDALWRTFVTARDAGDTQLAEAATDRMVELQQRRRLERLDDAELLDHIDALQRRMVAHETRRDASSVSAPADVVDLTDVATDRAELDDLLRELERRAD